MSLPMLEPSMTRVIVRRSVAEVNHIGLFIEAFAPSWTRDVVRRKARE